MNNEGARRFTEALAQALVQIDSPLSGQTKKGKGTMIDLLTAVQVIEGELVNQPVRATYLKPDPPPVPRADRPFRKAPRAKQHKTYFATEKFMELSDPLTLQQTPFADRCSPLRVLEDGEILPKPNVTCEEVWKHGKGRTCHVEDRLYFSATDETLPGLSNHTYTLALDPERQCEGALWLYPHDVARLDVPAERVQKLNRGLREVRIQGTRMKGPPEEDGSLTVRLRVGDRLRFEESVGLDRLQNGPKGWPVEQQAVPQGATKLELVVSNDTDSFVLLTGAKLIAR